MCRPTLLFAMLFSLPVLAGEPVILLTGFEPLNNAKVNSSWEAIRTFQGKSIAGHRVETLQLPYVYDAVEAPLKDAVAKFKPAIVLSFGEGARSLRIEKEAHNGYRETKPLDNKGSPPPRDIIVPDGKGSIPSGLPIEAMAEEVRSEYITPILSDVPEGSVGNECMYRLMTLADAPAKRGFVLLPEIGTSDAYSGGKFTLEELQGIVMAFAHVCAGKRPVRMLAVGDGFVNAFAANKDRWITKLAERMTEDGVAVRKPVVLASEQYKLGDVEAVVRTSSEKNFDYVFLQLGANDHLGGMATRNFSIADILKRLKTYGDPRIVVLSIPDFTASRTGRMKGYDSELSRKKYREFNETLVREAAEAGALYVDITPDTVQFGDDRMMLSHDIYYAPKMYELWAERVYATLKAKKLLPK